MEQDKIKPKDCDHQPADPPYILNAVKDSMVKKRLPLSIYITLSTIFNTTEFLGEVKNCKRLEKEIEIFIIIIVNRIVIIVKLGNE